MCEIRSRGIRGAITVASNEAGEMLDATKRLLTAMAIHNNVTPDEISAILFTLTPDLDAAFPALGAREMGWVQVPMLHAAEIPVPGSLDKVIRVLMLVNTPLASHQLEHVYLDGADLLRPDLAKNSAR